MALPVDQIKASLSVASSVQERISSQRVEASIANGKLIQFVIRPSSAVTVEELRQLANELLAIADKIEGK